MRRCGQTGLPGPALLFGFGALFEAEAIAIHFEDVDVVSEPVQKCAGEAF